jgi:hypothetical protein
MQYCNDCFAKMDDKAKHCNVCQSRDLRHFETLVTESSQDGVARSNESEDGSAPKFKVDSQYLVEPKPRESYLSPRDLLYFPATAKDRKRVAKKAAKGARKSRRAADGRTMRRRAFRNTFNLKRLIVFVVSSAILTIILNSTIWAYEGNPLGVQAIEKKLLGSKVASLELPVNAGGPSKAMPAKPEAKSGFSVALEKAFLTKKYNIFAASDATTSTLCLNVVITNVSNRLLPVPNLDYQLQGADLHVYPWDMDTYGDAGRPTVRFEKSQPWVYRPGEKYLVRLGYTVPDLASYTLKISDSKGTVLKKVLPRSDIATGWFDFKPVSIDKYFPGVGSQQKTGQMVMKLNSVKKGRLSDSNWDRFSPQGWALFDVTITNTQDLPVHIDPLDFDFSQSDGTWPESIFYSDLTNQLVGEIAKGESRRTIFAIPYIPNRDVVFNYEQVAKQYREYPNDPYVPQGAHWFVKSTEIN